MKRFLKSYYNDFNEKKNQKYCDDDCVTLAHGLSTKKTTKISLIYVYGVLNK